MNTGEPSLGLFPDPDEAEWRVLRMQKKLHRWATENPDHRFDDLANLVYDPAFLAVAWHRARGKGARIRPHDTDRDAKQGQTELHDATA